MPDWRFLGGGPVMTEMRVETDRASNHGNATALQQGEAPRPLARNKMARLSQARAAGDQLAAWPWSAAHHRGWRPLDFQTAHMRGLAVHRILGGIVGGCVGTGRLGGLPSTAFRRFKTRVANGLVRIWSR